MRANLDLRMAAAGLRGTLLDGGGDGLTLTGKTDAMVVQTSSGRGRGADPGPGSGAGGGNLEPARATVTRLRLGLEAGRPVVLGGATVLTPSLEVGVRHDGGDAETGFGLDLGGGLTLSDPARRLQAEIGGRGLLSHESKGLRDRGVSGACLAAAAGLGPGREADADADRGRRVLGRRRGAAHPYHAGRPRRQRTRIGVRGRLARARAGAEADGAMVGPRAEKKGGGQ